MEMRQLPVREKLTLEEKRKGEMDLGSPLTIAH